MALIAALLAASMGCQIWVEYITSAQNPSDILSREAYDDKDVRRRIADGEWEQLQTTVSWSAALTLADAAQILQHWGCATGSGGSVGRADTRSFPRSTASA